MKEEIVKRLEKTLEKIKELASEGIPILVEGKKDEETLRTLGVKGRIIKVSQRSLSTLIDELYGCRRVLILTDFDEKGEKMAKTLSYLLEVEGTIPLYEMRNEFKYALAGQVSCIEGIRKTLLRLNRKGSIFGGVKFGREK